MGSENIAIHLFAGGAGGTAGAVITCPLEVVKTRLQSSFITFGAPPSAPPLCVNTHSPHTLPTAQFSTCASKTVYTPTNSIYSPSTTTTSSSIVSHHSRPTTSLGIYRCLKHIVEKEGAKALFKGLGPNLVGVAPSRAVYFYTYAQTKSVVNDLVTPDTPLVHICSASMAGFTASTLTNPIWFIKTRLQLDQRTSGRMTIRQCIKSTWSELGWRGFYKGITASYYGITETVIHFVIYEAIKARLLSSDYGEDTDDRSATDFLKFMAAGATSKTVATCVAYPHEVARTRLREEGSRYRGFWQTLLLVWENEGSRGLYRGLATQLVRQIPNTAIMMATYEAVIYLCSKHLNSSSSPS